MHSQDGNRDFTVRSREVVVSGVLCKMHELTKALITCEGDRAVTAELERTLTAEVWQAYMSDNRTVTQAAMVHAAQLKMYELVCRTQERLLERLDELDAVSLVKMMEAALRFMREPVQYQQVNVFGDAYVESAAESDESTLEWIREEATLRGLDPEEAVREAQQLMRENGHGPRT